MWFYYLQICNYPPQYFNETQELHYCDKNVMGPWFGWCSDCFKSCCDDKNAESDHLFVTSFVQQPVKTVRRISSVGQTLTNEDGEEIEMPRHSSILQSYNGVPIPWSSNPITVQPGVSRYELETRLKTLPTISEMPNILPIPKETRSWKLPRSNAKKKEYTLSRCTDKSIAGDIPLIRYTANTQNLSEEDVFSQKECLKLNQHNFREEKQPRLHKGSCSSSPNLISLEQAAESHSSNYTASSLTNVSIHSNLAKSMTWLHSQSLEDVNDKQMEAERLARQYGLDLSLYRNASLLDTSDVVQVNNPSDLMVEEPTGFVEFSIYFNSSLNLLSIFVSKVGGLSGSGCNKLPYSVLLKVCAFSNKNIVKTSKKTAPSLNPVINQSFTFILKNRNNKILRMSVYNSDFLGKFDAIGHSLVSLQEFECNKNYRMKLYKRTLVGACTGMMQLACHNVGDRFCIKIIKVLNLLPKYRNHKIYVKISYYSLSRKSKEKISPMVIYIGNTDIEFNYEANFRIDLSGQKHNYFVITLKNRSSHTLFKNDESIGRIFIGPCFYSADGTFTPWGRIILNSEHLYNTFKMYT